jgi:Flp pilus assembly pilin Flp
MISGACEMDSLSYQDNTLTIGISTLLSDSPKIASMARTRERRRRIARMTGMLLLKCFLKEEQGQDLMEYTLLICFIVLAAAATFVTPGNSVKTVWNSSNTMLSSAAASAS